MLRLTSVRIPLNAGKKAMLEAAAAAMHTDAGEIKSIKLVRKSIDARRGKVAFVCSFNVEVKCEEKILKKCKSASKIIEKPYEFPAVSAKPEKPVAIVGFGPAGMFAALFLSRRGIPVEVFERGSSVDERIKEVERFRNLGILDCESNVQFGEGGAGTFSDGKLNTGISDPKIPAILNEFYLHGAPEEILTDAKPHIGTDLLCRVVKSIREEIISNGGTVRFRSVVTNIICENGAVAALKYSHSGTERIFECSNAVFAVGHSSRDTVRMLVEKNIAAEQKPFAVGVRIEHPQKMINESLYGKYAEMLPAASYKLVGRKEGCRGVYSFCMCPGGEVIAASSEKNGVVVNGMSRSMRNAENSNTALLVGVNPSDFGSDDVLAGIKFQQKIEKAAYLLGGGNYKAPVQLLGDFLNNRESVILGDVNPSYRPGYSFAKLDDCLPDFVCRSLRETIPVFENKIKGFARADAVLTGVESRSSSPVRFLRGENLESVSVKGLYPCGEGAGFAGGITSSAADGIRCAEMIASKINTARQ
ncbi:MAG: NAD(P)/FAD-dependent oxidoreductase [Acutalibacteraceae bacterium]